MTKLVIYDPDIEHGISILDNIVFAKNARILRNVQ